MPGLVNGSLGLPTELLEIIIAHVFGPHPRNPDLTNPMAPITVLEDGDYPLNLESNFMTIALVCRLWYQLAVAQFYMSCRIPDMPSFATEKRLLKTLVKHRRHIYRLTFEYPDLIRALQRGNEDMEYVADNHIQEPLLSTLNETTSSFGHLRHLLILNPERFRLHWTTIVEFIADLTSLETLGVNHLHHLVDIMPDKVKIPPRLSTLDVNVIPDDPLLRTLRQVPFWETFRDSPQITNLRVDVDYEYYFYKDHDHLSEILGAIGKHLVHLEVVKDLPITQAPVILPTLKHLEVAYPIRIFTLESLHLPSIQCITITSMDRLWEWFEDFAGYRFDERVPRYDMRKEFDNVLTLIFRTFLGEGIKKPAALQRVILADLYVHQDAPIRQQAEWDDLKKTMNDWVKRFHENGIEVLARYDRHHQPQPLLPFLETLVTQELLKKGMPQS